MERFEGRKKIVEDLKALGLLEKITEHTNAIGLCERSKTIVEPRASTQWFCRMKTLAEPAITAVEEDQPGKNGTNRMGAAKPPGKKQKHEGGTTSADRVQER